MRISIYAMLAVVAITSSSITNAVAQSENTSAGELVATTLVDGLAHPWALAFLPDGRFLVTERRGQLRIVDAGQVSAPITGVPDVYAEGQGGLLDVVLAPDFASSGQLYLTFAEPAAAAGLQRGQGTAVLSARLVLEGDAGRLEDQKVIFRMNNFTTTNRHFGSRLVVGQDGNLWVTLGDRGDQDRAQMMDDLAGAVIRIAPDGSVPGDNPHVAGWAPELWSKGHRNPQGAALRADGTLFTVEHGAGLYRAGDWRGHAEGRHGTAAALLGPRRSRPRD